MRSTTMTTTTMTTATCHNPFSFFSFFSKKKGGTKNKKRKRDVLFCLKHVFLGTLAEISTNIITNGLDKKVYLPLLVCLVEHLYKRNEYYF